MRLIETRRIVRYVAPERLAVVKQAMAAAIIEKGHGITAASDFMRNGFARAGEHEPDTDTWFEWEVRDD